MISIQKQQQQSSSSSSPPMLQPEAPDGGTETIETKMTATPPPTSLRGGEKFSNQQSPPSSPQSSCNSSHGSSSGQKLLNNNNISCTSSNNTSIASLVPGGVVTTQNISTVIKPKSNNNSLQFVKIQTPELSKKAVEQIKLAEETKISREKIKEVEEEWQNNLLNWKSKRRQQFVHTVEREPHDPFGGDTGNGRKIKTFAEMMEQRAKSGNRLGFHLQRYIGSSGDDNDDGFTGLRQQDEDDDYASEQAERDYNECQKSDHQRVNEPNRVESQQQFSSSPQPSDRSLVRSGDIPRYDPFQDVKDQTTEPESIAAVEPTTCNQQFNSTPKQGVSIMLPPVRARMAESLQPQAQRQARPICDDESCSDEDDLDDEEELEEQKHIQRVAFEAKLKAFEKLTKPTVNAPALRPTPPPKYNPNHSSPPSMSARTGRVDSGPKDPRRQNVFQLDTNFHDNDIVPARQPPVKKELDLQNLITQTQEQISFLSPPADEIAPPTALPLLNQQSATTDLLLKTDIISQSSSSSSVATSSPELKSEGSTGGESTAKVQETDQHQLASRLTDLDLNRQYSNASLQVIPDTTKSTPQLSNASPPHLALAVSKQQPSRADLGSMGPTLIYSNNNNNGKSTNKTNINNNYTGVNARSPNILPMTNKRSHNRPPSESMESSRQHMMQAPTNERKITPPPQPRLQQQQQPPQQPPSLLKDDRERAPPLQVSGKKRCSSCKEELGRGAAAFVVESLALVYHTNCFRCSVCHVNLANGFRGVDVRVHAGALHCQNCYSKDGLNYSRV